MQKTPLESEILIFRRVVPQWIQVKIWDFIASDAKARAVQRILSHFNGLYFRCCPCCAYTFLKVIFPPRIRLSGCQGCALGMIQD